MTAPDPAHSLGIYQRIVARHLSDTVPMSFEEAHAYIGNQDLGYAAAVLIRLAERGVARQASPGIYVFMRGPKWNNAAQHYRWTDATQE